MTCRFRSLPLAVLAGIFLLFQALAIGLGPGARVCLDPDCAAVVLAVEPVEACSDGCADAVPEPDHAPPGDCVWLPIADQPVAELARLVVPLAAPTLSAPLLLRLAPLDPVRLGDGPPACRPPPHLDALRSIVLTC